MDENVAMIPYYVHEGEMTRMERVVKRLWIALLIIFLAFVGTNLGWIIYESQFETISYEQDADFDGDVDTAIANEKMFTESVDALKNDMGSNVGLLIKEMRGQTNAIRR